MKRALIVLLLLLTPLPLFAWNEADHDRLTRRALADVAMDWGLDQECPNHPLSSLLEKLGALRPDLAGAWHWSHFLKVNAAIPLDRLPDALKTRPTLSPIDLLAIGAVDPDDGRDQNLFIRDAGGTPQYAFADQRWFGVVQGPDSQAFRHLEKPPFHPLHPSSTFGLPFRSVGEASKRVEVYFLASQLAFALDEDCWGWRFLGNALHYLEDLHQPYHAGQLSLAFLWKGLGEYLGWGRRDLGFIPTFAHLVSNSHRFYEDYVSLPDVEGRALKASTLEAAGGMKTDPIPDSPPAYARRVRDESNRFLPGLMDLVTEMTVPKMFGRYSFKDDQEAMARPEILLKAAEGLPDRRKQLFAITEDRFENTGRRIRSLVRFGHEQRGRTQPEVLLEKLSILLFDPEEAAREAPEDTSGKVKD